MKEAETFTVRVTSRLDHLEWHYGRKDQRINGSQLPELLAGEVVQVTKHICPKNGVMLVLTPAAVEWLNSKRPDNLPFVTGGWFPESLVNRDDPGFPYTLDPVRI